MRMSLAVLLFAGLVMAEGEGEAPVAKKRLRGLVEGKFVDEYFGIVYEAKGLAPGYGMGSGGQLFTGRSDDGVEVEISLQESPQALTSAQWHELLKQNWEKDGKKRVEVEHGSEPVLWSLYVEESLAGFKRHHAWRPVARGFQCFLVHAQVQEKTEKSGEQLKQALGNFKITAENSDSLFAAHLVAKQQGGEPDAPATLLVAAALYSGQKGFENPALALSAALLAEKHFDSFEPEDRWNLIHYRGLAELNLGANEEAIPTWKRAIDLSKATANAAESESNSRYNLTCAYAKLGRLDEAFAELKLSFAVGVGEKVAKLKEWAKEDGDLAAMRKDPRWLELYPS